MVPFKSVRARNRNLLHPAPKAAPNPRQKRIWIDLDNTPHVPFFLPIIGELETRGYVTLVTARDAFQVKELAQRCGLKFTLVGRHYGRNPLKIGRAHV